MEPFELGSPEKFTGRVLLKKAENHYEVMFAPYARTHWHKHPKGQRILVTKGKAWVAFEEEGKIMKKELSTGTSFYFKPGQKHWHGASPEGFMEHIAIAEGETQWTDSVTDPEYFSDFPKHHIVEELTKLTRSLSEAEKRGDTAFFKKHLSEQLIFRRASGKVITKSTFLEDLKPNNYEYNIPFNITVNVAEDGQSAAISLTIAAKIMDPPIEGTWRNIRLFQQNNDVWQIVSWYNEPA